MTIELPRINIDELISARRDLRELHGHLRERYVRERKLSPEAADARARASVESVVRATLLDFGAQCHGVKSALLDDMLASRLTINDFYASLMGEATGAAPTQADMKSAFANLKKTLSELRKPVEEMAHEPGPRPNLDEARQTLADDLEPTMKDGAGRKIADPSTRRLTKKGFRRVKDVGYVKRYTRGRVEFTIEGGVYKVRSVTNGRVFEFREFDTFAQPYREKPLSSQIMQAHHGCQDALMDHLFREYGYSGNEAPTMWLRNSTADSPHGKITHEMQNPNEADRLRDRDLSYAKIRELGVADLKAVGASDAQIGAYLDAMDAHFREKILPNIQSAVREGLLPKPAARRLIGGLHMDVLP